MAELEQEVRQHLFPADLLGEPHAMLRAFRALLFLETPALLGSPALQQLPKSTVLLHLLSRLPAHVQSPHQRAGVSPKQFSHWMDAHSAAEILGSIGTALQAADTRAMDGPSQELLAAMVQIQAAA